MKYSFTKDNDWVLIITTFLLAAFGLVMIFSASYALALREYGDFYYFLKRQSMWLGIGTVAFLFLMHFPYRFYKKLMIPILIVSFALLVLVIYFGVEGNGAQRWLIIGPFTLQPS
ncbi:FtsW/RodA/SpoVE family cell cycle protein, partial [Halalkalibacterium halodurans]